MAIQVCAISDFSMPGPNRQVARNGADYDLLVTCIPGIINADCRNDVVALAPLEVPIEDVFPTFDDNAVVLFKGFERTNICKTRSIFEILLTHSIAINIERNASDPH